MSEKKYSTPETNELIPDDAPDHKNDGTLLDPRCNELIEDDGPTIEKAEGGGCKRERVEIASGLIASHCPGGGLSMFRNGVQIYTTEDLTEDERRQMIEFREKCNG